MNEKKTPNTPDQDTLFVVSGGGKGITAKNVIALAEAFQCKFILLGRSQLLETEPAWAEGHEHAADLKQHALQALKSEGKSPTPKDIDREVKKVLSSREIQSTLDAVASRGGSARYISADITQPDQLQDALGGVRDEINGVLHGAGALADKYIDEKTEKDFELVYGVKVDGLQNMLASLGPDQLEFILLFSSVAGFYGNPGQADYALGNEVLNKMAHFLRSKYPEAQVLAVDWGPWDGGMVTPQLKRILKRRNVDVIPIEVGTKVLLDLLSESRGSPQWVVGSPMPKPQAKIGENLETHHIHRQLSLEENPFLRDHIIGGQAVLPTVCAVGWLIQTCEGLYPGYTFFEVDDYRVFKGILFDETLADEYQVSLEEVHKTKEEIQLKGMIQSKGENGMTRKHYRAAVTLIKTHPDAPQVEELNLDRGSYISGPSLYEERTLFHGPRFQGVQEVLDHSRERLVTRCRLPAFPRKEQGQFPAHFYNPYLTDAHLQSLLIWASLYRDVKGLPLRISNGRQYRPLPFDTDTYVTMNVESLSKHTLVADVVSYDLDGRLYSKVQGAEITLSERLNELFLHNQLREPSP